jgi:hypothetical protein
VEKEDVVEWAPRNSNGESRGVITGKIGPAIYFLVAATRSALKRQRRSALFNTSWASEHRDQAWSLARQLWVLSRNEDGLLDFLERSIGLHALGVGWVELGRATRLRRTK